jgi:hypothetical protein
MTHPGRFSGILLSLSLLALAADAWAYPVDRRLFQAQYGKAVRCELCHSNGGGTERNGFGKAWQKAGETLEAFRAIEGTDSDGDGVKNLEEIKKGSNPGDARSTPDNPGTRWTRGEQIPIPGDQLVMTFGPTDEILATEPAVSPEQARAVEQAIGRPLAQDERYPTLYFAVVDGKRVAVAAFAYPKVGNHRFTILMSIEPSGNLKKVVMFRAGQDSPGLYQPFLGCLAGKNRGSFGPSGSAGCPEPPGRRAEIKAMTSAVRAALSTVAVLFQKTTVAAGGGQ